MIASRPRKSGSAIAGIWEASILIAIYAPLAPSISTKYSASGWISSKVSKLDSSRNSSQLRLLATVDTNLSAIMNRCLPGREGVSKWRIRFGHL